MKNVSRFIILALVIASYTTVKAQALELPLVKNTVENATSELQEKKHNSTKQIKELKQKNQELKHTVTEKLDDNNTALEQKKVKLDNNLKTATSSKKVALENVLEIRLEKTQIRFDHYENRFSFIIKKLETRIEKMKAAGEDVSAAELKLQDAKKQLAAANNAGDAVIADLKALRNDPQHDASVPETIKMDIRTTRQEYKRTKQLLVEVVTMLKDETM